MTEHTFVVYGIAEPQGSARAFVRGGHAIVTSDNPDLKAWRQRIATEAQRSFGLQWQPFRGALMLAATFYLPRPVSLPKKVEHHLKRPDCDKLIRGLLDALTGVAWGDDSQVVELRARKQYATVEKPCQAVVTIREIG